MSERLTRPGSSHDPVATSPVLLPSCAPVSADIGRRLARVYIYLLAVGDKVAPSSVATGCPDDQEEAVR